MKKSINLPAWLFGLAIVAQLLLAGLCTHLLWSNYQPKGWSLDSTQYYKTQLEQGKLNLNLYIQQQSHEERLRKLDKKKLTRFRQIDSMSVPVLQSEIDRLYNRLPEISRSQADSIVRKRGTSSVERQSQPDHAGGRSGESGHAADPTSDNGEQSAKNGEDPERIPSGSHRLGQTTSGRSEQKSAQTASGPPGELGRSNRSRSLPSDKVQAYWHLIQSKGYVYPDVAFAISAVETGYWWTPPPGNNLFGMKKSSRQAFYIYIGKSGYCFYGNEHASLADYADYEKCVIKKYNLKSRADYLSHIQRRFCPNPTYRSKLFLAFRNLELVKARA